MTTATISEPQRQVKQFLKDGYLVVPDVLSQEQVSWLRSFFRSKFDIPPGQPLAQNDDWPYLLDIWSSYPEVRWLLFHEPVLRLLKELLGDDLILLPESNVCLNAFTPNHKDAIPEEVRHGIWPWSKDFRIAGLGGAWPWDQDYLMIALCYYMQDNTEEYGGGVDVEPGSHLASDFWGYEAPRSLASRISGRIRRIGKRRNGHKEQPQKERVIDGRHMISLPTKAVDLVLLDMRINHRGTIPRVTVLPEDREKVSILYGFSRNTRHFQIRLDYVHKRDKRFNPKGLAYPADLVQEAKARGISLGKDRLGRV